MSYPDPAGIFAGTAEDYARYRPRRPGLFLDLLAGLAPHGPIADIGAGPGSLALDLAARGRCVFAIDANPAMIAAGRRAADALAPSGPIHWHVADAHHLPDLPRLSGATFADSFHWLDRAAVLEDLDLRVKPNGFVAVLMIHAAGSAKPWWYPLVENLLRMHVGPLRHAGPDQVAHVPVGDHESVLRASAFNHLTVVRTDQTLRLSLDEVVGWQYTQAYSSPAVLGPGRAAFDADLRAELLRAAPSGQFTTTIQPGLIIARRGEDQ